MGYNRWTKWNKIKIKYTASEYWSTRTAERGVGGGTQRFQRAEKGDNKQKTIYEKKFFQAHRAYNDRLYPPLAWHRYYRPSHGSQNNLH